MNKTTISAEFAFDSAHFLPDYVGKCARIHGHRWLVKVTITGDINAKGPQTGMILDFTKFKKSLKEVEEELDHKLLITEGSISDELYNLLMEHSFMIKEFSFATTAENMSAWIFYELKESYKFNVVSVTVYETPNNSATYKEED